MQVSPMLRRDPGVCSSTHHSINLSLGSKGRQLLFQSRTLGKQSRQSFPVIAAANPIEKVKEGAEKVKEGVTSTISKAAEVAPVPTPKPKREKPAYSPIPKEKTVLLQGFGWSSHEVGGWYNIVKENIPRIKEAGFTHIWLPPPSQSVAPQGYLPGRLYDLNTPYGSKEELLAMLKALKEAGIKAVGDIVINHRCADQQSSDGTWNKFSDDQTHDGKPVDWGRWAITSDDPDFKGKGNPDTGEDYHAAPDLDHLNEDLRKSLVDWLNWLHNDIGFDCWRFDFVKGYGAEFMNDYVGKTVGQETFNVGEYWADLVWGDNGLDYNQNGPRQTLCDWVDKAGGVAAFDFTTKGILNEAVKNTEYWRLRDDSGKNPGLMGWWPSRAVTFIDNHDTGSTQQHWPYPQGNEESGYAYLLTHPGMPCVLWEHYFDNGFGDAIKNLVDIRKRNGINSRSKLDITIADGDCYLARIDDKLILKMGPRYELGDQSPREEDGWKIAASGNNYAVWEVNN